MNRPPSPLNMLLSRHTRRREFIALLGGAAVGLPLATRGQAGATRRICALIAFAKDDPETEERLAGFQQGLAKRGWVEGRNIHIDYRFAAGRAEPFPVFAKELVALQPDVILGHTPGAIVALQHETRTIPIVFVNVSDPIGMGFIASLPRPGGNITGVLHYEATIIGKWLAMLREISPHLTRAALLANPKVSSYQYFLRSAEATAPSLGIDLTDSPVQTAADIERAIEELARRPNNGLILPPDASTIVHRDLIVALAARHRLPAVYALKTFVVKAVLCDQVSSVSIERAARRCRASMAHFAAWASRLITCRFGKPQKSSSFGHGKSRFSLHTRNSGTRWSTSALLHSRLPVWPQRRACSRRRSGASLLGAFQNCQAITQAQCQVAFLLAPAPHRSACQPKR
jgi:putative tryptophan/tyrosine transport system substrate-binding protein